MNSKDFADGWNRRDYVPLDILSGHVERVENAVSLIDRNQCLTSMMKYIAGNFDRFYSIGPEANSTASLLKKAAQMLVNEWQDSGISDSDKLSVALFIKDHADDPELLPAMQPQVLNVLQGMKDPEEIVIGVRQFAYDAPKDKFGEGLAKIFSACVDRLPDDVRQYNLMDIISSKGCAVLLQVAVDKLKKPDGPS